jgi:2'-5' RNA ligase
VTPVATIRAFVAVNLSVPTLRAVAELQTALRAPLAKELRVAWVPPANLHLTLKFLGDIQQESAAAIGAALERGLGERAPFEVRAGGVGAFPDEARPRVLWVGLTDEGGALARLAADVETWLEALGFPREARPFRPHLTIGRVKDGHTSVAAAFAPHRETSFGTSSIREVVLYESRLRARGAEYVALRRVPIGAPAPEARRGGERDAARAAAPATPDAPAAAPESPEPDDHDTETDHGG